MPWIKNEEVGHCESLCGQSKSFYSIQITVLKFRLDPFRKIYNTSNYNFLEDITYSISTFCCT